MKLLFRTGKWVLRKGKIPGPNCRAECCDDGGGPPPPNDDCTDTPNDCFYELKKCNGVRSTKRVFISVFKFNRSVAGDAPGDCYWATDARNQPNQYQELACRFITNPPDHRPVARANIQPILDSGNGIELEGVLRGSSVSPPLTCCNCSIDITGCQECPRELDPNTGLPVPNDTPCCCNLVGSCIYVTWGYTFSIRVTRVSNPDDWIETTTSGAGVWHGCYNGLRDPIPNVTQHHEVGPAYTGPVPAQDTTFPITQTYNAQPNGALVGGCCGCGYASAFNLIGLHRLGDQIPPNPTFSCNTVAYNVLQTRDFIETVVGPGGVTDLVDYRVEQTLSVYSNSRITGGEGDCGGGCYDTAARIPPGDRPLWVKALSRLRTADDAGLGDTLTRIAAKFGGDTFKRWFRNTTGRECGCASRANALNAKYPYTEPPT